MRWSSSVPADVRARLSLDPGDRVLAGAVDRLGHWHVGTTTALYVGGEQGFRGVAWQGIDRAFWDKEQSTLTVVEVADFGQPEPTTVLAMDDPGRLLELVRERITASVLLTRRVRVEGAPGKVVTVIARRSPERTGDITFAYLIDRGLEPDSAAVRAAGLRGVESLTADLGI